MEPNADTNQTENQTETDPTNTGRQMPEDVAPQTHSHTPDPAPAPDDGFASPDDFTIDRDGEGKRLTKVTTCGPFGKVEVIPLNYGDIQEYFGDGTQFTAEHDLIAELLDEYFVRPDFSQVRVDKEWFEDLYPGAPKAIIQTLLNVSKVDADVTQNPDGTASVTINDEGN